MDELIQEARKLSRDIDKIVLLAQRFGSVPTVDSQGVVWIEGRAFHINMDGEIIKVV